MKSVFTSVFLISTFLAFSQTFTSDLGGNTANWDNPATWGNPGSGGGAGDDYPGPGDNVIITGGDNVQYNITSGSVTYGSLTLATSGSTFAPQNGCSPMTFSSYSDVSGTTISSSAGSGLVTIDDDVTLNGSLLLASSILINGSFDMQGSIFVFNDAVDIEINSSNGTTTLDGTISISSGTLSLTAGGSNDVDIAASASITIGNGGAMHLEGNGSQHINNAGTITVQSGGLIAITGSNNITFTNSGTTTFEYGSAFYPGVTGAKITTATNAPNWEIDLTNDGSGHWRQVGFPFEAGTVFTSLSGTDFNPNVTAGQRNVWSYNADQNGISGNAFGWEDVSDLSAAGVSYNSVAYNIYTGDVNYPYSNGGVVSVSASVPDNVDSRTFTLYNYMDPDGTVAATDQGWNLVYNPFSCWIDLESVMANNTNMTYTGVHFWHAANDQFIAYLTLDEVATIGHSNQATVLATGSQYVNPFQAFWVKLELTDAASEDLTISLSNRTLTNAGSGYNKTSNIESLIRLNTFAVQDSAWDQVLLVINPDASYDREGDRDAYDRTPGFEVPNMSLIATDNVPLAISSMPLDSSYSVPMTFTNAADGEEYYIDLDQSEYDAAMSLTLEDVKNGTFHDLEAGNYRFTYDSNWGGTRFILHLDRGSIGVGEEDAQAPSFWVSKNTLYCDVYSNLGTTTYQVVDVSGRIIHEGSISLTEGRHQIDLPQLSNGAHIIRILPENASPINIKYMAQ